MSDNVPPAPGRPVPPPPPPGRRRTPGGVDAAKIVRRYLSALDSSRPGRSVRRTAEAVANRILKIDELVVSADPLTRLHLTQERIDLHAEHVRLVTGAEAKLSELEGEFVKVARSYGDRHGITYAAWRQVGVDAVVLERAGIHRTRPPLRDRAMPGGAKPTSGSDLPPDPAAQHHDDGFGDVEHEAVAETLPLTGGSDATDPAERNNPADRSGAAEASAEASAEPPVETPANGLPRHDSPPMRRRLLTEPATDLSEESHR